MKVLRWPVEMIAWFDCDGMPTPTRFRIPPKDGKGAVIVTIGRARVKEDRKLVGNRIITFRCQSIIKGEERIYELRYESDTCKWYLYKM